MNLGKRYLSVFICVVLLFGLMGGCMNTNDSEPPESSIVVFPDNMENSEITSDLIVSNSNTSDLNSNELTTGDLDTSEIPVTSTSDRIDEIVNNMTLEEKVGQMMLPSFRKWQDLRTEEAKALIASGKWPEKTNITELNDEIRQCIERNHFGGIILFEENLQDAEQTYRLIKDLQRTNQKESSIPLFIATDQEGGYISRLGFGTTGVGNMALAATGDVNAAKQMALVHGKELNVLGINLDFAPVMDMNTNPSNPVIGVRSFSDDPDIASRFGVAFMEGLSETNTVSTMKHFPGHGDTDTDSHTGFPLIEKTYDELKKSELLPFQTAIDNGAEMIMTAHIQYPQIENKTYVSTSTGEEVYIPATMSKTILTDILKGDMGFEGVVVTDALDMAAIANNFEFEDVLCMTINAGADMLILPGVNNSNEFEQTDSAVELTVKLVNEGKISEDRINDAVTRILKLKEKHGIYNPDVSRIFPEDDIELRNAVFSTGSEEYRNQAWEIAEKTLTLVKNENNAYPLSNPEGDTLILFADSCASRVGYGELVKQELARENITVMVNTKENKAECMKASEMAENVILISRAYNSACLDPKTNDGFSTEIFDEIIESRHKNNKTVIVISCQLPYDAARFPDADAMVLTYCSSSLREIPEEHGEGSAYSPNLAVAIKACFEGPELKGKLPVNIPKLDENYQITDEILYKREN